MSRIPRAAIDHAEKAALEVIELAKSFCEAGDMSGKWHVAIDTRHWLRQADAIPDTVGNATTLIQPLLSEFARTTPYPCPIERAGFIAESVFDLVLQVGTFAATWREALVLYLNDTRSKSAMKPDDYPAACAKFVSNIRRPSGSDWKWLKIAIRKEAECLRSRDRNKSARGKGKRSRRQPGDTGTKALALTAKQTEAMQLFGECSGSYTAIGKRMGIGRKAAEQHVDAAYAKLGQMVPRKRTKTASLPIDKRGQAIVTQDVDGRAKVSRREHRARPVRDD